MIAWRELAGEPVDDVHGGISRPILADRLERLFDLDL